MRLLIDRQDLKPEHKDINCSRTQFDHFLPEVQEAIIVVGKATFREHDDSNYNVIYPPNTDKAKG